MLEVIGGLLLGDLEHHRGAGQVRGLELFVDPQRQLGVVQGRARELDEEDGIVAFAAVLGQPGDGLLDHPAVDVHDLAGFTRHRQELAR